MSHNQGRAARRRRTAPRRLMVFVFAGFPAVQAAQTPRQDAPPREPSAVEPAPVSAVIVAPTPELIAAGAETIAPPAFVEHVRILAEDSLRDRDTPSPGVEAAARYVANQFAALGLRPAGKSGTWFQRYVLPAQFDLAGSRLVFKVHGKAVAADFASTAKLAGWTVPLPGPPAPASAFLIAGKWSSGAAARLDIRNKVVLYVPPAAIDWAAADSVTGRPLLDQLREQSRGVVVLSDDTTAAAAIQVTVEQPEVRVGLTWGAQVRPAVAPRLGEVLAEVGVDLARLRMDTTRVARDVPGMEIVLEPRFWRAPNDTTTAPNVVAVLEGADPKLKAEHVVFVAHMDRAGARYRRADRANGGDNAPGVAALIELASAFSRPEARPARSLIFLATSGGARNLWGSRAFASQVGDDEDGTLDARFVDAGILTTDQVMIHGIVVAVLNIDLAGRPAADSVTIDGMDDVRLSTPPDWRAATHPELRLTVVEGGSVTRAGSDHFAFVLWAFPSLAFRAGSREAGPRDGRPAPAVQGLAADLAARITRLMYYVGHDVANDKRKPQWTVEGRQRYLDVLRP